MKKPNNRKMMVLFILTVVLILFCILMIFIKEKTKTNKDIKIIDKTQIQETKKFNNKNKMISLLYKPLGSDTFSEITSTPTSGAWTITTDCKGMSVTWNNDDYTLDAQITQAPASCKINFTEIEQLYDIKIHTYLNGLEMAPPTFGYYTTSFSCTYASGTYSNRYRNIIITNITSDEVHCDLQYNTYTPNSNANLINKIKALASSTPGSEVTNGTNGKLFTVVNGTNAHIRYTGKEPSNYVWFNNEMWRIIGVIPVALSSGATETTSLVKIIRNNSIGAIAYDAKNSAYSGAWGSNTLYTLLNSYYWGKSDGTNSEYCYGYVNTPKTKCDFEEIGMEPNGYYGKMTQNVYWSTGPVASGATASTAYNSELLIRTLQGYIGLMSYSDYGYATDSENYLLDVGLYNTTDITSTNWILRGGFEWINTQSAASDKSAWYINRDGDILEKNSYMGYSIRPALYLKEDVYVVSGNGTKISPYILGQ